ncbi:hypothetical protein SUGI_0103060 [Cryptomeria japonica]|nr:hypothetical protein SUGI_0103060 [Cryptomeria japonica]
MEWCSRGDAGRVSGESGDEDGAKDPDDRGFSGERLLYGLFFFPNGFVGLQYHWHIPLLGCGWALYSFDVAEMLDATVGVGIFLLGPLSGWLPGSVSHLCVDGCLASPFAHCKGLILDPGGFFGVEVDAARGDKFPIEVESDVSCVAWELYVISGVFAAGDGGLVEESIKQLLRGVPGFRRVEQLIRSTRKLIIRHDNGKGSQIVEKLKEGYTIESDTTVTAE